MCVIALVDDTRATKPMVEDMWQANTHGGGAAWREKGKVKWRKGLDLETMIELAEKLPLPHVLHFRISSVGGICDELCHPFLISKTGENELEGETKTGSVLFHNGSWHQWRETMLNAAIRANLKIPMGKFSDTRAMSWLASIYGDNIMELINEKGIIFSLDDIQVFSETGWKRVNGVYCSNDHFFHASKRYKMCIAPECKITHGIDASGLCWQCRNRKSQETQSLVKRDDKVVGDTSLLRGDRGGVPDKAPFRALIAAAEQDFKAGKMGKKQFKKLKKRYEREAETHWKDIMMGVNRRGQQILH